jgi:hypothetical protein
VPAEVANSIAISAFGGWWRSEPSSACCNKHGAICSRHPSPASRLSAIGPVAMGKFAARPGAEHDPQLSPQGLHIAHFVIDGIRNKARTESADRPDSMLDPDAIALSCWNVLQQPRSADLGTSCGRGWRSFSNSAGWASKRAHLDNHTMLGGHGAMRLCPREQ